MEDHASTSTTLNCRWKGCPKKDDPYQKPAYFVKHVEEHANQFATQPEQAGGAFTFSFGAAPAQTSGNLFGFPPAQATATAPAQTSGNLFGASSAQTSGGLFGTQPTTAAPAQTGGFSFGASSAQTSGGLFGTQPTTAAPATFTFSQTPSPSKGSSFFSFGP